MFFREVERPVHASLPRLITVPTGIETGELAVVVAAAVFHPVTHDDVIEDPL